MQYFLLGIRCLIGVLFFVSSISKVAGVSAFGEFRASVQRMTAPARLPTALVASAVVVIEFSVWGLLVVPTTATAISGLLLASLLLTVFATGIVRTLRRGVPAACRCFGSATRPLKRRHVVRNLALAVISVAATAALLRTGSHTGPVRIAGGALALFGGAVTSGLVVVLDDICDLFQPVNEREETSRGIAHSGGGARWSGLPTGPRPHAGGDQEVA
ncbi:MauE/DoxX family redox-associated membrane protein [Streptomyces sp. NPDC001852]|uniref:MauE/DoxX family redox-associated membrane protein n=1 Tax=Streptomyces sp. NPDC001852 TaxID=3364619 RepID=UPI0036CF30A0